MTELFSEIELLLQAKLEATEQDVLPKWRELPLTVFPLLLESELARAQEWILYAYGKGTTESWNGVASSMASFLVLAYMWRVIATEEDIPSSIFVKEMKLALQDANSITNASSPSLVLATIKGVVDHIATSSVALESTDVIDYERVSSAAERLGALSTVLFLKAQQEAAG